MVSPEEKSVIDRAKRIYFERLQSELERDHRDRFVSIEPESESTSSATRSAKRLIPPSQNIPIAYRTSFELDTVRPFTSGA